MYVGRGGGDLYIYLYYYTIAVEYAYFINITYQLGRKFTTQFSYISLINGISSIFIGKMNIMQKSPLIKGNPRMNFAIVLIVYLRFFSYNIFFISHLT